MPAPRGPDELLRFEQVLDALNCGAALIDRSGNIEFVNNRFASMIKRTKSELAGKNIRAFYSEPTELAYLDSALARSDESRDAEFVLPRPDGSRLPVLTSARPLARPFDHLHVVTVVDIAARKIAEDDLKENLSLIKQVGDSALEHAIELRDYSEELEQKVKQRTDALRLANLDAIYMLAVASEAKDLDTGRHVRRIQRFAEALARKLGLNDRESHDIGLAAILHDIGKIHIPDNILNKPTSLDDEERAVMRQHTLFGERILSKRQFFDRARRVARSHHENWDGSGYPDGLSADQIPLEARIVRVVDVYDALTNKRVYKPAWPKEQAVELIRKSKARVFDADIADAFGALIDAGEIDRLVNSLDVKEEL